MVSYAQLPGTLETMISGSGALGSTNASSSSHPSFVETEPVTAIIFVGGLSRLLVLRLPAEFVAAAVVAAGNGDDLLAPPPTPLPPTVALVARVEFKVSVTFHTIGLIFMLSVLQACSCNDHPSSNVLRIDCTARVFRVRDRISQITFFSLNTVIFISI